MKANELRIGNYVFNKAHERKQLTEVYSDCSVYEPIPLTEEWLLKFGFELNDGVYKKKGWAIFLRKEDDGFLVSRYGRHIHLGVQYIHRLQNLWYELTDEELTLSE